MEVILKIFSCDRVDRTTSNVLATDNGLVLGSRWGMMVWGSRWGIEWSNGGRASFCFTVVEGQGKGREHYSHQACMPGGDLPN